MGLAWGALGSSGRQSAGGSAEGVGLRWAQGALGTRGEALSCVWLQRGQEVMPTGTFMMGKMG